MKILFVSTRYHPHEVGGAEVTVRLLAEGLVRAGGDAVVVTLAPDGLASQREINGVRVHYLPLFNVFFPHGPKRHPAWRKAVWQAVEVWNPVMARRLGRVVDQESPDLVHIHNVLGFTGAVWPALRRRQIPILQTLHDHYAACANSLMYRTGAGNCRGQCLRCQVFCAPRIWSSRHVDALTTVSARLWERISTTGAFPRLTLRRVIHNCNDHSSRATPRTGPAPGTPLRLGFLGRLEPIKGPQILLEAARRIGADKVHVRLGGVGQAAFETELKSLFQPDLATFVGHVTPATLFDTIDLLVAPSLVEEASGRVVHEALGFGIPTIGVATGGMAELIEPGRTGYLVPAGDVQALETLLQKIIETPPDWTALSAACLAAARAFSFGIIFDEYRSVWHDTIQACSYPLSDFSRHDARSAFRPSPSDA